MKNRIAYSARMAFTRWAMFSILPVGCIIFIKADRSIFRPLDIHCPAVYCSWQHDTKVHCSRDWNWRASSLFDMYEDTYVTQHLLPAMHIPATTPHGKPIDGWQLHQELNQLVTSIQAGNPDLNKYKVLKDAGFNFHNKTGLLVLKSKEQPVVIKLSLESPQTFTKPYNRGFELCAIFMISGSTPHMLGFTRLPTAERIYKKVRNTPWESRITIPRKWYWKPENQPTLTIRTENIGKTKERSLQVPSVYAIICDAIEHEESAKIPMQDFLQLCTDTAYIFDPHLKNGIIERGTGKIALIDTEDGQAKMGFYEPVQRAKNYIQWYAWLTCRAVRRKFATLKPERLAHRHIEHTYARTLELCN